MRKTLGRAGITVGARISETLLDTLLRPLNLDVTDRIRLKTAMPAEGLLLSDEEPATAPTRKDAPDIEKSLDEAGITDPAMRRMSSGSRCFHVVTPFPLDHLDFANGLSGYGGGIGDFLLGVNRGKVGKILPTFFASAFG